MSTLANTGNLIERLTGNIEAIIDDRESMLAEILSLRVQLMERDKEAVKAAQDMNVELEEARAEALYFEQERVRVEARLRCLNDRLIALVNENTAEAEFFG